METTLIQKLLDEVKCHSCSCQLEPPLVQCSDGYHYCDNCAKPSEPRTNHLLEKLCFKSPLKCSFSAGGCNVTGFATAIAQHEKRCPYSPLKNNPIDAVQKCEPEDSELVQSGNVEARSLEELFRAELECPVCTRHILLPVGECVNGHLVCQQCFKRLKDCPVCRGPKCFSTNVALERFYRLVDMPCYYASDGCSFRGKGSSIPSHLACCTFAPRSCPLVKNRTCTWQGNVAELVDHCKFAHRNVLSLKEEDELVIEYFLTHVRLESSFHLFYVKGILFRCGWEKFENQARFTVNYLAIGDDELECSYEMSVLSPDLEDVLYSITDLCTVLQDDHDGIFTDSYMALPYGLLKNCCDKRGTLRFRMRFFDYNVFDSEMA